MSESAWRRQMQPAKFRDAPFSVRSADTTIGRRTVLHEYPQRDTPYAEDLGRKARQFTVEAVIVGADYFTARDALIEALEESGPGLLIHPYYGRRMVALANPARISESFDEGGLARFSLDFVEAGENAQPTARTDTQSLVDVSADQALGAIADDFSGVFSVDGQPEFVEVSALGLAKNVMAALDAARQGMIPDLSVLSEYTSAASGVLGSLNSLIRTPADLAGSLLGLFAGLRGLARNPLSSLAAVRNLFGYGDKLKSVPTTTLARRQQSANQAALVSLTRRAAVIEAARAASQADYESYDQAVALRDELADRLDIEGETASEPVYVALSALRVAVVRDITRRGADLARVSQARLPATLPALVAAYQLYGDARRDADLISRNPGRIRHPGFVPGGVQLEVLADKL